MHSNKWRCLVAASCEGIYVFKESFFVRNIQLRGGILHFKFGCVIQTLNFFPAV